MTSVVLAGRTHPVSKEEFDKVQAIVADGVAALLRIGDHPVDRPFRSGIPS